MDKGARIEAQERVLPRAETQRNAMKREGDLKM
jgi:hypothetical protein